MSARQVLANAAAVVLSLLVGTILCELGARLVLNPADYLSVTTLRNPILGMTIAPNSPGFDSWGFRNPAVPETVDIVTVGDSHTFGNTAKMDEAWPSVVQRRTGLTVYNMGLGGYGPNQYYQVLTTRGLALRPKLVVCGLYMGDDFENAFSLTYGFDYWTSLRTSRWGRVEGDIWGDVQPPGLVKAVRNWLSRNSMVYRIIVHGPALSALKGRLQTKLADTTADPSVSTFQSADGTVREAFRPIRVAAGLDQSRAEVGEGMRLTFHFLREMNLACRKSGCTFAVVIIPTKETVFAQYLQSAPQLNLKDRIEAVISNEEIAKSALERVLEEAGIPYVDALPALRQSIGQRLYYPGPADMHPGPNGYRVIGETIATFVREAGLVPRPEPGRHESRKAATP
jgi:hypothetical protein